jgi:hypothetical protein
MLLGHTDVVPADAGGWRKPAVRGALDDAGYVWGRGACDMKNEVATRAVALAALARSGVALSGDLVLVAAADEEDGSQQVGMSWLVQERPDLATDYVLNEGASERLKLADGQDLRAELAEALGSDIPHELEVFGPVTGGTLSPIASPLFDACRAFVRAHDPEAILVPTICNGFTDSHYVRSTFGSVAYGIWPVRTTPYEVAAAGVHGDDERIHVADLGYAALFHVEVCRTLLADSERQPRVGESGRSAGR